MKNVALFWSINWFFKEQNWIKYETKFTWNDGQFCQDDGATDGGGHFLGTLYSKTNVTVVISDSNKSLESCTLSSTSLFLNGHNLEDFIFQGGSEEKIDNFKFLSTKKKKKSWKMDQTISKNKIIYFLSFSKSVHSLKSICIQQTVVLEFIIKNF